MYLIHIAHDGGDTSDDVIEYRIGYIPENFYPSQKLLASQGGLYVVELVVALEYFFDLVVNIYIHIQFVLQT